jgi:hypothetical protein
MPWSGGAFTRTNGVHTGATLWVQDRDAGTKILATRHDTHDQDLADGINSTLEKSGSNAATGNLDLGSKRITLLADGTAKTDAATVNQIQSNGPAYQASDTGTANAHVIALSPAITAYASGQKVTFKSGAASTTASTLNVNGLGVKAIKKLHDQDIASGDIESGSIVTVVYDGTNFQMTSQTATSASAAPEAATSAKTAAYTVIAGDAGSTILCSAASADYAVALTAAGTLGDGFTVTLKKSDATKFMITINPNSTETIDDLPDLKLRFEHSEATLICDGSNWHLISHANVAYEYNAIQNPNALVDQYSHITRTALATNQHLIDRWQMVNNGSATARWTFSVEADGGIDGVSNFFQMNCTTADASPGSGEANYLKQSIIGNNLLGAGFMGTDGFWEDAVYSIDLAFEKGGGSSLSAPYTLCLAYRNTDGNREILADVDLAADNVWQRIYFQLPQDTAAHIEAGVTSSSYISIGIYGGSGQTGTAGSWGTGSGYALSGESDNLADATGNKLKWTNVKFQPGQIATPFVPKTYEEELNTCQFYFYKIGPMSGAGDGYAIGFNSQTTYSNWIFDFPVAMRAAPTLVTSGTAADYRILHAATATNCSVVPTITGTNTTLTAKVEAQVSSGLTVGEASMLQSVNSSSFIAFSSEL